ncbi:hypothetical protein AQJ43_37895 [Streptomyces avermitilis]|nr:hypothetical protein AQJ43_37895 [Streptomyces avermitilis]
MATGQPGDADHGAGRQVATADRAGDQWQAQGGPVDLQAACSRSQPRQDQCCGLFSIVLAPAAMAVVHGCLTLMPRIQSPARGSVPVLMPLAPRQPCPDARAAAR